MSQSDIRRKRTVLQKPIDVIDRWFTRPEPNAAGNLGLFRVLYASFYLWFLSSQNVQHLVGVPADHRQRVLLIDLLPADPPAAFFVSLEILLVAALCLLVVGFRVRLATWVVLVVGTLLEAYWVSFDPELGTILLVFFIPFFMLLGNAKWSETYSVDAILRRRAGERVVEPTDPSWPYSLPARAVLARARGALPLLGSAQGSGGWDVALVSSAAPKRTPAKEHPGDDSGASSEPAGTCHR